MLTLDRYGTGPISLPARSPSLAQGPLPGGHTRITRDFSHWGSVKRMGHSVRRTDERPVSRHRSNCTDTPPGSADPAWRTMNAVHVHPHVSNPHEPIFCTICANLHPLLGGRPNSVPFRPKENHPEFPLHQRIPGNIAASVSQYESVDAPTPRHPGNCVVPSPAISFARIENAHSYWRQRP